MKMQELVKKNRSIRRFDNSYRISENDLNYLIDNATKVASAANLQNIRYIYSNSKKTNDEIFRCLNWAGYLEDWPGPDIAQRPSAYIIMVIKSSIEKYAHFDAGIAAQTISLSACEMGLGACLIASINKPLLSTVLELSDEDYSILLCIALGKADEKVVVESAEADKIQYWRDDQGLHHVPKYDRQQVTLKKFIEND